MQLLVMLIGIALGFLLVWKSEWILENFGRIDWAEIHLGTSGGTRMFWKLVGLAFILLSLLYYTGCVQDALTFIFVSQGRG
ncbi:MAG: hypothetical protein Q7S02_05705 [bacterium]|nr:hypothetical protein [bacterium]